MNKQVEEMAKVACVGFREGDCENCKSVGICSSYTISKKLYDNDYRKTSDVAREIFEEIDKAFEPTVSALFYISETLVDVSKSHISEEDAIEKIRDYLSGTICSKYRLRKMLAELKKKYESEGADND